MIFCFAILSGAAGPALPCLDNAERAAFDTAALHSDMMILALTCGQQDNYNTVVRRFMKEINGGQATLGEWFYRAYGTRAQTRMDDYNSQLANARSEAALRMGDGFCSEHTGFFADIMALSTDDDFNRFAATQRLAQPLRLYQCSGNGTSLALPYDHPGLGIGVAKAYRQDTKSKNRVTLVVSDRLMHGSVPGKTTQTKVVKPLLVQGGIPVNNPH